MEHDQTSRHDRDGRSSRQQHLQHLQTVHTLLPSTTTTHPLPSLTAAPPLLITHYLSLSLFFCSFSHPSPPHTPPPPPSSLHRQSCVYDDAYAPPPPPSPRTTLTHPPTALTPSPRLKSISKSGPLSLQVSFSIYLISLSIPISISISLSINHTLTSSLRTPVTRPPRDTPLTLYLSPLHTSPPLCMIDSQCHLLIASPHALHRHARRWPSHLSHCLSRSEYPLSRGYPHVRAVREERWTADV